MSSCRSTIIQFSFRISQFKLEATLFERFLVGSYTCITVQGKAKLKRWGNSYGVVVPKEVVEKEGLKEGEVVEISVRKASDIRRLFGKYPFKDLQYEKEEMRKGWE